MIFFVALLSFLQIGDLLTTEKILKSGGKELNPVMDWLFTKFGMHNVLVVKVFLVSCAGVVIYKLLPILLIPLCLLYLVVVGWNSYQIYKSN